MLETIYFIFRKTVVQGVAVVKLGVYDGGGNCFAGVNRHGVPVYQTRKSRNKPVT